MEEDYQKALELFFAYGYGCCMFKHDICGDKPEVLDGTSDSSNFLPLECFASPRCSPVSASFEDVVAGVHVERWRRSLRGAPIGDFNGTF